MAARNARPLGKFRGRLVLVGAGNMGGAMLHGWIARGLNPRKIVVLEPQPGKAIKALMRRGLMLNPRKPVKDCGAVVVAVKPQSAPDVLPALAGFAGGALVLSIMAGRTIGFLQRALSPDAAIVRAMPNLPASVGRGITVAVANRRVSTGQRRLAGELLAAVGAVEWIDHEPLMDAVTAVSGSGPAYVFLLAETLTAAAIEAGLPAPLAARLARETVAGAGDLLRQSPLDAATLRKNVTSPGGTTAAALDVLMGLGGLDMLMIRAVAAATRRSRELAG